LSEPGLAADPRLVDRLAAHRTVGGAPREELVWIAGRGVVQTFPAGVVALPAGIEMFGLWIVLEGQLSIRIDRGAGPKRVMEWRAGDVTGVLPYSRARITPGETRVDEPTTVLTIHRDFFPDMIRECHELTAILVHTMVDRARHFTSSAFHDEKLLALGRLSAGLAHELNNPASAVVRGARALANALAEIEAASRALALAAITEPQMQTIDRVHDVCMTDRGLLTRTPIQQADREDAIVAWLEAHGADPRLAESLGASAVSLETLDTLAGRVEGTALKAALRWLAAGCATRDLASQIESAATRVHSIVAAVKGFTYMDEAAAMPVDVARGLSDTLTVLQSKTKAKSARVHLDVERDLPHVQGYGGELNQVWLNIIDNAIDAIAEGGQIDVSARREGGSLVVRVVDNGTGIPAHILDRIFDPFFTTKPFGQGTGLGLDISRRLVRRHDGVIDVESRPGRTEFRITLPVAAPATTPASTP